MRLQPITVQLQDARGQNFPFESASIALDFAHSGARGRWAVSETIHGPDDLASWLERSEWGLRLSQPIGDDAFASAIALREAVRRVLWSIAAGREPGGRDVARINRAASGGPLVRRWTMVAGASWVRPTIDQVIASLAIEAVDVLASVPADRIRCCAADDCPLVFVDVSRAGSRRWCSMQRCGNRAKVRAHRDGRRAPHGSMP